MGAFLASSFWAASLRAGSRSRFRPRLTGARAAALRTALIWSCTPGSGAISASSFMASRTGAGWLRAMASATLRVARTASGRTSASCVIARPTAQGGHVLHAGQRGEDEPLGLGRPGDLAGLVDHLELALGIGLVLVGQTEEPPQGEDTVVGLGSGLGQLQEVSPGGEVGPVDDGADGGILERRVVEGGADGLESLGTAHPPQDPQQRALELRLAARHASDARVDAGVGVPGPGDGGGRRPFGRLAFVRSLRRGQQVQQGRQVGLARQFADRPQRAPGEAAARPPWPPSTTRASRRPGAALRQLDAQQAPADLGPVHHAEDLGFGFLAGQAEQGVLGGGGDRASASPAASPRTGAAWASANRASARKAARRSGLSPALAASSSTGSAAASPRLPRA